MNSYNIFIWNVLYLLFKQGFFGIACPAGLKAAAGAITVGTAGAGAGVVAGAVAGSVACSVAKDELCKRNVSKNGQLIRTCIRSLPVLS